MESKTVKIYTSKSHRVNSKVTFSCGDVFFNERCVAEVEKELAEKLLKLDTSISIAVSTQIGNNKNQTSTKEQIEAENKELEEEKKKAEEEVKKDNISEQEKLIAQEKVDLIESMMDMTVVELREICKESKMAEIEWKKLNKVKLVNYIVAKNSK